MFEGALFLLQIAVVVGVCRLVAWAFGKLGQPQVVGEMAAGIALGPTLFGSLAPAAYHALFPPDSLPFLNALSQVGLVIFMFLVGVRVDFEEFRGRSGLAIVTSNVSVLLPLMLGIGLAQYLFPRYGNTHELAFALFIGTAMSVTALPVLARILLQRNLLNTPLGSVAIACAAVDDITAWILLSTIVAMTTHDPNVRPIWLMIVYLTAYLGAMLILRGILHLWSTRIEGRKLRVDTMLTFLVLALLSGAAAEWIGIHALVGAFIAGLITPRMFRQQLIDKLEDVTLLVFIPLFFALTGIRTNLIFRGGTGTYLDVVLILLVAVASKWGGTMVGARLKGMNWRDACQLGLMMNTRGLVELVVLNVGLEKGILSPVLFSMMVFMALVTTFMTTPLMACFAAKKEQVSQPA